MTYPFLRENDQQNARGTVVDFAALRPGGDTPDSTTVAYAGLIVGGVALLYVIRKGFLGGPDNSLIGSTTGALQWFGYYLVVVGTVRVLQLRTGDTAVGRALGVLM